MVHKSVNAIPCLSIIYRYVTLCGRAKSVKVNGERNWQSRTGSSRFDQCIHCACPFSSACESTLNEKCHIAFDIPVFFLRAFRLRRPVISMNEPSYKCQDSKYVVVMCSCLSICALKVLLFIHLNYTTLICIAGCVRGAFPMRVCVEKEHVFADLSVGKTNNKISTNSQLNTVERINISVLFQRRSHSHRTFKWICFAVSCIAESNIISFVFGWLWFATPFDDIMFSFTSAKFRQLLLLFRSNALASHPNSSYCRRRCLHFAIWKFNSSETQNEKKKEYK